MLRFLKKTIYLILTCFIVLFIGSSFFLRAKYDCFKYGDKPILVKQNLGIFITFILFLTLLSFFVYMICLHLDKYNKKIVIPCILFFTFLMQICFILAFSRLPTDDSGMVVSLALNMLYNHDYSSFATSGYLHMFPFNLSIVLYLKGLFFLFPDNYLVIKTFNILFSLITTLMIYLIYKELNYNSKENDYGVLIFAATYIPSIFMSNFIYNDTIATAFFTTAIYFSIKFIKEKSIKYIIISSILLSIGNYFRSLGLIILIAIILYLLFNFNKIGIKRVMISICIIVFLINIPCWTQNAILKSKNIVSESIEKNSAPVYMWLNMGLNVDKIGFWDDFESYNIYRIKGNFNKEKSSELFKEEIKNKLNSATNIELLNMYYRKLLWTWTEGTYQVERYGMGFDASQVSPKQKGYILGAYCYSTYYTELFCGGSKYRKGLFWAVYVVNFLMYCCIFIRLVKCLRTKKFNELLLVLVVLGFIAFYLLWEIKSRYIFPVYPILLILSYMGFKDIYVFLKNKIQKNYLD
jgi:hypothetical protein